jgi:hypothetical protein
VCLICMLFEDIKMSLHYTTALVKVKLSLCLTKNHTVNVGGGVCSNYTYSIELLNGLTVLL